MYGKDWLPGVRAATPATRPRKRARQDGRPAGERSLNGHRPRPSTNNVRYVSPVFPSPRSGWAAVGLSTEPEPGPGGPLVRGRARTGLPLAVARSARWLAARRPPPAAWLAAWTRRKGASRETWPAGSRYGSATNCLPYPPLPGSRDIKLLLMHYLRSSCRAGVTVADQNAGIRGGVNLTGRFGGLARTAQPGVTRRGSHGGIA
jgi:hypothetical protein